MDAVKIYEDAVRKLEKSEITLGEFEQIIAPLRNVIQSKYGKWLPDNRCGGGYWVCSSCKNPTEAFAADVLYKYCPFCGAKMER